ncbi:MAG: hypothetical protein ABIT38_11630, partial [Gemmatimonadaceae bacterium]
PRLNATGLTFKWAGYRMPNEIGDKMEVKKIEEYLAARGIVRYSYGKTQGQKADQNSIEVPGVSIFAAGPVGTNYGAFLEFERTPDGAVDIIAQLGAVWGKETGFGGIRAGQGHLIVGGAVAGFDRPTGMLAPLAFERPTTAIGIPFTFGGDLAGAEVFYVVGSRNRTSVQIVNAKVPDASEGMSAAASTNLDWVVTNQLIWDDAGAGLTAVGYFGRITGLDAGVANLTSRYSRLAASANKFIGPFEVVGGYVYSSDSRLPVTTTSVSATPDLTGSAYWFTGQYSVPKSNLTFFGRYEALDPNRDVTDDAIRRVVFGSVLPVNVPEYIRLGIEYFREMPQLGASPRRHGLALEVQMTF